MADPVGTDPQADPIGQASVAVASTNIKTFGDMQLQYANLMLSNAIANQQRLDAFNLSLLSRATDLVMDKSANAVVDAVVDQIGVKAAQTTPPDTSGQILAQLSQLTAAIASLAAGQTSSSSSQVAAGK